MDFLSGELLFFALGALGYWVASGAVRADYKILHVFLGVVWFSAIGLLAHCSIYFIAQYLDISGFVVRIVNVAAAVVAVIAVVLAAYFWRKWVAEWVFRRLRDLGVTTTPFGPSGAWEILEATPDGREFHYVRVSLVGGKQLGSDLARLTRKWMEKEIDFSPDITVDEQGNVALIVTEIWDKDVDDSEKNYPMDENGRTEFTYIPASNITRIQVYLEPTRKRDSIPKEFYEW